MSVLAVSFKTVMKDSFAVGGMRGDITRSDYSTLIIERSPVSDDLCQAT